MGFAPPELRGNLAFNLKRWKRDDGDGDDDGEEG
jgi:hypothetical protein